MKNDDAIGTQADADPAPRGPKTQTQGDTLNAIHPHQPQARLQPADSDKVPTVANDPALVAAKEAQKAAAAWDTYAKAHPTLADEYTPEFKTLKERSEKADDAFVAAPVTSIAGVKLRIATHRNSDTADLPHLYATPAREIDYEKECGTVDWKLEPIISALRDAERLAGAS